MNKKFFITKHCQKRYLERVHNNLNVSDSLLKEIFNLLHNSIDVTSHINNLYPRYILYLYEHYQKKNFHILKKDKLYFICRYDKETKKYNVLTCYFVHDEEMFKQFGKTILSREEIFFKIIEIKNKLK